MIEGFRVNFKIEGTFINEGEVNRLIEGLQQSGYTLRTSGYAKREDGCVAGFWFFSLDINSVVLRAVPDVPSND